METENQETEISEFEGYKGCALVILSFFVGLSLLIAAIGYFS
ncbi:hypothetical protein [Christiangramia lutea]|nr:hypothetical protein [Christiangramia lutea]